MGGLPPSSSRRAPEKDTEKGLLYDSVVADVGVAAGTRWGPDIHTEQSVSVHSLPPQIRLGILPMLGFWVLVRRRGGGLGGVGVFFPLVPVYSEPGDEWF